MTFEKMLEAWVAFTRLNWEETEQRRRSRLLLLPPLTQFHSELETVATSMKNFLESLCFVFSEKYDF